MKGDKKAMASTTTVKDLGNGIKVKRWDCEERTVTMKNGKTKTIPARWEEHFFFGGRELANRSCTDEYLYINSDCIARGEKVGGRNTYESALKGTKADAFKSLFEILGITKDSKLSEFMNVYF